MSQATNQVGVQSTDYVTRLRVKTLMEENIKTAVEVGKRPVVKGSVEKMTEEALTVGFDKYKTFEPWFPTPPEWPTFMIRMRKTRKNAASVTTQKVGKQFDMTGSLCSENPQAKKRK